MRTSSPRTTSPPLRTAWLFLLALIALLAPAFVPQRASADDITLGATYTKTVLMKSSSDHITGATGLTLTITASKNGAAFASITPVVTELSNGWYKLALTPPMVDTVGSFDLHITASGADANDTHDSIRGPPTFDPSTPAGLEFWFEPSLPPTGTDSVANTSVFTDSGVTLASDTGAVAYVRDRSRNGWNATQTTTGQKPVYVASSSLLNGLPALRFTATSISNLSIANPGRLNQEMKAGGRTYAIVCATTSNTTNRVLLSKHQSTSEQPMFLWTADSSLYDGFIVASKNGKVGSSTYGAISNTTAYTIIVRETPFANLSGAGNFYWIDIRINGRSVCTRLANKTAWSDSNNWRIGSTDQLVSTLAWDGDIAAVVAYNNALSDDDTRKLEAYFSRYGTGYSNDITPARVPRAKIACAGDSITAGSYSKGFDWPSIAQAKYTDWDSLYVNFGVPGQNTNIASIYPGRELTTFDPSMVNIATIWLGTNDLATVSGQAGAAWTRLQTLIGAAKAAGYKVIVATTISRGGTANGSFESDRQTYNASIRAGAIAAGADYILDLGSSSAITVNGKVIDVSVLGAPSANSNTTYFHSDATHLTAAGEDVVAQAFGAAVNYLINQASARSLTVADYTSVGGSVLLDPTKKLLTDSAGKVSPVALESLVSFTGTAQSASSSTLRLAASGSPASDSLVTGNMVAIVSGTGAGQTRVITAYTASTTTATVGRAWTVTPDATSVYAVLKVQTPRMDDSLNTYLASTEHTAISGTDVPAGVQLGMTAQGFTPGRGPLLDNLDALVSSRLATSGYTAAPSASVISAYLDANSVKLANLDGTISGITAAVWGASSRSLTSTANPPGWAALLALLGSPANGSLAADLAALPNASVTALMGTSYITIDSAHTSNGVAMTLSFRQWMALMDAVPGGDSIPTVPVANGTATITYYLRGQTQGNSTKVSVSTLTYDASKNQVLRTVKVQNPFPVIPLN